ncbi:MAG: hypothetical protein U5K38_15990 [Woeseiaceae bacterium]|nr:hypothetical protein [Woeseiaceae bacterium]
MPNTAIVSESMATLARPARWPSSSVAMADVAQQVNQRDGAGNGQQHGAKTVNGHAYSKGTNVIREPVEPPDDGKRYQHHGIDGDDRPHCLLPGPVDTEAVNQHTECQ